MITFEYILEEQNTHFLKNYKIITIFQEFVYNKKKQYVIYK